ncbi:MAG: prenyltransferase [Paludibacteraceae bacterium]|nr:prenyltransferase [Paludibacteraceae bacterium]
MMAGMPQFSWGLSLIALLGVITAHLGMNLADDYFDYKKDTTRIRQQVHEEGVKTHMEKCHYITSGKATIRDLACAICCFLALAGIAGTIILYYRTWHIAVIAISGLLLGLSYSGGPLKLGYRGFGEFVIGIMFGPLLMLGMSLASANQVTPAVIIVSFAVGLFVINIGYVHSVLDLRTDTLSLRKSFAVILKNKTAMLIALACFSLLPFVLIIIAVIINILHWSTLITLLLVPMAIHLVYSTRCFLYNKHIPLEPKWWMGPMGDWKKYQAADMDWFLFRWLVARNMVTFFCLILIIIHIIL